MSSVLELSDATTQSTAAQDYKLIWSIRFALVAIGLIPVVHIFFLVAFTCSNALSHDYQNVVPPVAAVLEPGYNWLNFVHDTSMGPHCLLSGVLIHACTAALTDWNVRCELYVGLFLVILRVVLLVDCIGERWNKTSKWVLLAFFLWLNFGTALSSTLTFGVACISAGVGLLGYALGIWGLTRSRTTKLSLLLVLAGGLVSASFGQFWALATWTTFLLVILMCKTKEPTYYIVWMCGTLISAIEIISMAQRPSDFHPRINFAGFINVLGRCFTNDIGTNCLRITQSEIVGCVGLLLLSLIAFLHFKNRTPLGKLAAPSALMSFGLLGAVIISMSRDAIAPWYSLFAMHFWLGLLAVSMVLFQESRKSMAHSGLGLAVPACALLPFVIAFGLYLQTNITYKDKDFFRRTHAPCSESAMRHFRTMPTYGELALFAGQVGDLRVVREICEPAWRHHWSAFSPHQEWALQGDFLLHNVTLSEQEGTESLKWIDGTKLSRKRHWDDPEHLNLALDLRNQLLWTVDLPALTTRAVLRTAVVLPVGKSHSAIEPAMLKIVLSNEGADSTVKEYTYATTTSWNNIEIPLQEFAGKRIRIEFSGFPSSTEKVAVLAYPKIDVDSKKETRTRAQSTSLPIIPSNTDLFPDFPSCSEKDLVFLLCDDKMFDKEGLYEIDKAEDGTIEFQLDGTTIPGLTLVPPISVSSREYTHLLVEVASSKDIYPRLVCVQVVINGTFLRQFFIPMLFDETLHKYSYDLKLLELDSNERITGVKILPTYLDKTGKTKVRSLRFVKRTAG